MDALIDDAPMCGWHDRYTYQALWDSIAVLGGHTFFTSDLGRFPVLDDYEVVILMHHGFFCPTGYDYSQRTQLIQFVCGGGNLIIMPIRDGSLHNVLLNDPRWFTGIQYGPTGDFVHSENIEECPPYTNGVEYLHFEFTCYIYTAEPAYPFAWDSSGTQTLAAISYPSSDSFDCPCENGGRILAIADNRTFEGPVVGYIEPMDHRFIMNAMTAMAGLGDTLYPCEPTPSSPVASIDTCLEPGAICIIYGENLYSPMILLIGGNPVLATNGVGAITILPDGNQEFSHLPQIFLSSLMAFAQE